MNMPDEFGCVTIAPRLAATLYEGVPPVTANMNGFVPLQIPDWAAGAITNAVGGVGGVGGVVPTRLWRVAVV